MDGSPNAHPGASEAAIAPGRSALGPDARRLVRTLSVAVLLEWAGAGAILPLLPLYVRHRGGSDAVVGAVMAAYFVGAFVFQYGAGRLSDRFGRLPVLVGGLLVYATGSLLFLLPGPAALGVAYRALQGAGSGASMVAALATVSHAVPLSHRGRAAGLLYGAELGGLAFGPVLGSFAGLAAMRWLFVAAAAASIAAVAPVLRAGRHAATETSGAGGGAGGEERRRAPWVAVAEPPSAAGAAGGAIESGPCRRATPVLPEPLARRSVTGALLAAAVIGLSAGVYEACWTLLMTRHGAQEWEIGVSWTLFALPFALVSRPAGWLADHFDRRLLAVGSLLWSAGFCAIYPFLPGYVPLMVLGVFESFGLAVTLPSCQSLLGQGTAPERHGQAQGTFAASQTGTTAVAAAAGGALFGLAPWLPFVVVAGSGALLAAGVAAVWWRVPGRIRALHPRGATVEVH